jgi:hypothetical protein
MTDAAMPTITLTESDVHSVLQRAVWTEKNRVQMTNANFKCNPAKAELVEKICSRHGTTRSAFLRGCLDALLTDYLPARDMAQLEGRYEAHDQSDPPTE